MHPRSLAATLVPVLAAALLGNAFVGRESLRWFRELRHPRMSIPLSAFVAVGGVYYVILGIVRYRALTRANATAARLALAVLALNELWNVAFFGGRSTPERVLRRPALRPSPGSIAKEDVPLVVELRDRGPGVTIRQ
jgi:tryptophan-rich sensory protein